MKKRSGNLDLLKFIFSLMIVVLKFTSPSSGESIPAIMFMRVVFPAPFSPVITEKEEGENSRLTPWKQHLFFLFFP